MATISKYMADDVLHEYDLGLESGELPNRKMLFAEGAMKWLITNISELETDIPEGRLTPKEQFDDLVYRFTIGERFSLLEADKILKELKPLENDVWEFKTPDLRLFGWFYKRCHFICTDIDRKEHIMEMRARGIYMIRDRYVPSVMKFRDNLNLAPPKSTTPIEIHNEIFT